LIQKDHGKKRSATSVHQGRVLGERVTSERRKKGILGMGSTLLRGFKTGLNPGKEENFRVGKGGNLRLRPR